MQKRILIVDDQNTNLRIYEQYVKMMGPGFSAKCFQNALEALEWLRSNDADLIVADYRMPEINGADFIRQMREQSKNLQIPAIMITAQQDRNVRISALDAGATDFLQSPVSNVEFKERIQLLLTQHAKKKEWTKLQGDETGDVSTCQPADEQTQSKSMLEQIIDTSPVVLNATDRNGKVLFLNGNQAKLMGKNSDNLVGESVYDILDEKLGKREKERNIKVIETGAPLASFEERVVAGGVELTLLCNKSPLTNKDGETIGVLTTAIDITARKSAEEHRAYLALHDMLTGLPNRALLAERMRETIEECKTSRGHAALLLLDLDRFKIINDTRGHQAGDQLLKQVAGRISSAIAPGDFAARIGGDEFAIILKDTKNADEISIKSQKLLKLIGQHYSIDDVDQIIGCSIGISLIPADGDDPDELLRLADLAMYEAKSRGRNRYRFFSPQLNQVAQSNATLESELRKALERNEFTLEYQPIVGAKDRKFCGLEALVRWNHPERGRLLPKDFLRVANDSGLIDEIGGQIVEVACREIQKFQLRDVRLPPIAVNVSPRQFHAMGMSETVLSNIEKYEIPSEQLSIEITEELLLDQSKHILKELDTLRKNGVNISIDDFGTGYSSLQYLRDLPANKLKIDRTFVARIEHSAADRAIISTITHLAHALEMRVVAEGVETEQQFSLIQASGCDEVQGFYLGRPLTSEQLEDIFLQSEVFFEAEK